MDSTLLTFFNQTLTHPLLDILMIALTSAGLALLPMLGTALLMSSRHRRLGITILVSLVASLILTVIFQYLALRPRPETVRLLLPTPNFPAFPSGHAAAAFAVALVIGLSRRRLRWWIVALSGAFLIASSRVYLGHHYPSDIFGGAVLGASVGAACYGLLMQPQPQWQWLLWPQIAIATVISQMAYLQLLPIYLLRWPMADKVMHFLLIGAIVFWLNLWLSGRGLRVGKWLIPLAILVPLILATMEEGYQVISPVRSGSFKDLTSDLLGMLFFWWLSVKFVPERPMTN